MITHTGGIPWLLSFSVLTSLVIVAFISLCIAVVLIIGIVISFILSMLPWEKIVRLLKDPAEADEEEDASVSDLEMSNIKRDRVNSAASVPSLADGADSIFASNRPGSSTGKSTTPGLKLDVGATPINPTAMTPRGFEGNRKLPPLRTRPLAPLDI